MIPHFVTDLGALRPGDILACSDGSRPEILVMGTAHTAFAHGYRIVRVSGRDIHIRLEEDAIHSAWVLSLIPWGASYPGAAAGPVQHVVTSLDDIAFHIHEAAVEAATGRWS